MSKPQTVTFQDALEVVESLPEHQQEDLIDIIRRRIVEHRRYQLVVNIKKARQEFIRGEVKRGSVDDLMNELSE
ncbi:MAG TPA: hypothetical protein ENN22_08245 [bacterium]|nr:hypothetical protein [bacterium]